MNNLLNVDDLDLLTVEEKKFNELYVKKLLSYAEKGGVGREEIKDLTAGAAVIAKRQQSRSATALLKFNIAVRGKQDLLLNKTTQKKSISKK